VLPNQKKNSVVKPPDSLPHLVYTDIQCVYSEVQNVSINVIRIKFVLQSLTVRIISRSNQHNVQICTTALFYMLAPTCFGSSLPSSGSFWIRLSYVYLNLYSHVCQFTFNNIRTPLLSAYILPQYYSMLSHSPFYSSSTLDTCFISYMFYRVLTHCTPCCYYVILTHCTPCCYYVILTHCTPCSYYVILTHCTPCCYVILTHCTSCSYVI
jgi:hypothetical protein